MAHFSWKHLLGALVLGGALAAAAGGWLILGSSTTSYPGTRTVILPPDPSFAATIDSLQANGIVGTATGVRWLARLTGWNAQMKEGHYAFTSGVSNYRMLDVLRRGLQEPVRVTIPPGSRPRVVAAVVGKALKLTPAAFRSALRDTALARRLGTDVAHLFGYMLPETYHFYWQTPAREVVERIKEAFDAFYARELAAGADSIGLRKSELVTVASIVQWETYLNEEKPMVAEVYLNRLDIGMPLQADPTVQYALLQREGQKRRLFFADYEIEHPYNTYQFRGLPPGPITNPAPSTLRAVAYPAAHDYLYFVADGTGGHAFSRTLREHNRKANAYRRLMRQRRANSNSR
ncbi:endolytic transglycosylase MltG [Salisaeta longa]|uniref:endolytic transglycosylase MltG n=1 Tax=Salisaeta longa TaxID=503170 RepID=UPI001E36B3A0|nr:endolytic transglycosylase MltG [Salisaeta longa]